MKQLMIGMLIVGVAGFGLPGNASAYLLGNTDLHENVAIDPGAENPAVIEVNHATALLEATLVAQANAAFVAQLPAEEPPTNIVEEISNAVIEAMEALFGDDPPMPPNNIPNPDPPEFEPAPIPVNEDGYPVAVPPGIELFPGVPPGPHHPPRPPPETPPTNIIEEIINGFIEAVEALFGADPPMPPNNIPNPDPPPPPPAEEPDLEGIV